METEQINQEQETGVQVAPVIKEGARQFMTAKEQLRLENYVRQRPAIQEIAAQQAYSTAVSKELQQATVLKQATDIGTHQLREEQANTGFFKGFGMAYQSTTTGYLVDYLKHKWDSRNVQDDAPFALSAETYHEIVAANALVPSNYVFDRLNKATTVGELEWTVDNLKKHQELQRVVGDRAWTQFLANAGDAVENLAILAASAVPVFGNIAAISARTARAVTATKQAAGLSAAMYAGQHVGKEYTAGDILLGAATVGGLTYALHRPKGTTLQVQGGKLHEVPAAPSRLMPEIQQVLATTPAHPPVLKTARFIRRPELDVGLARARRETDGLGTKLQAAKSTTAWRKHLPEQYRTALDSLAEQTKAVQVELKALTKTSTVQGDTVAARELGETIKQLNTELHYLKSEHALVDAVGAQTPAEVQDVVRAARKAAKAERKLLATEYAASKARTEYLAKRGRTEQEELADLVDATGQQVTDTATVLKPTAPILTEAAAQAVEDAVVQAAKSQKGMLGLGAERLKALHRGFTQLVSEHFKLHQGHDALRRYIARVVEDPTMQADTLQRSAASELRKESARNNTRLAAVEDALVDLTFERSGMSRLNKVWMYDQKFLDARTAIEEELSRLMHLREQEHWAGLVPTVPKDPKFAKLVKLYEDAYWESASYAFESGLRWTDTLKRTAGYMPRAWDGGGKMLRITQKYGKEVANANMTQHIMKGLAVRNADMTAEELHAIATAIITRARNKAGNVQQDFMGQLGRADTTDILVTLRESGVSDAVYKSIEQRLVQSTDRLGSVKYVKPRLDIDMTLQHKYPDGTVMTIADYVETDALRLLQSYQHTMAGRGALAKVGIGGDDVSLGAWQNEYNRLLETVPELTKAQRKAMSVQMEHVLSDFTGIRRDDGLLSETMQTLKATAVSTMLHSMGVFQIAETAVISSRYGALETFTQMLKGAPVIKNLLREVGTDPKLYDEFVAATGVDVTKDIRMRQFVRQIEVGQLTESDVLRVAQGMANLAPFLTAQKYVHSWQAKATIALSANRIFKAAAGDSKALAYVQRFGNLSDAHLEQFKNASTINNRGNFRDVNWAALPDETLEVITDAMLRMQDATLLYKRAGYGASYERSAVGQLLGQFTSYVAMSHNALLRGEYAHGGALGVAGMLAHQYPMMLATTYINEARKGNVLDLDNDEHMRELLTKALSYTSVLSFMGDFVNAFTGTHGRSMAALQPLSAPVHVYRGLGYLADGDGTKATGEALALANALTFTSLIFGSKALEKALREDN